MAVCTHCDCVSLGHQATGTMTCYPTESQYPGTQFQLHELEKLCNNVLGELLTSDLILVNVTYIANHGGDDTGVFSLSPVQQKTLALSEMPLQEFY